MSTEQWFEKATEYFSSVMTKEEMQHFEAETAASEELSQLMQLWKTADAEAALYEKHKTEAATFIATHKKLKADFINDHPQTTSSITKKEPVKSKRKVGFSLWQWTAVAAIIAGIILAIDLLIPSFKNKIVVAQNKDTQTNNIQTRDSINRTADNNSRITSKDSSKENLSFKTEPSTLYAEAFLPDKAPENQNGPLDNAFFYYTSGQYTDAIKEFDNAHTQKATRGNAAFTPINNFYASYYKGISMMMLKNTSGAVTVLHRALLQSPAGILRVKTQWYLALAYLKEEKISSAAEMLKLLMNNPDAGMYKSKAEKLLTHLDQ